MTVELTEKQEAVLQFIEDYQMANGKSPTIREMREHFNLSSDNSILKHIKALHEKGFIQKDDTPRGISLLDKIKERLETAMSPRLPILGSIPAGGPVISEENTVGWMDVGSDLADNSNEYFLLQVTGDSMMDVGILEDDMVVVNTKKTPKNGDIVVALIDNENTLKRLITQGGKTYLKAENKNYNNLYPVSELYIQGVVTSLIRQY